MPLIIVWWHLTRGLRKILYFKLGTLSSLRTLDHRTQSFYFSHLHDVCIHDPLQLLRPGLEEVKLVIDEDAVDHPSWHRPTPQFLPVSGLVAEM